MSGSTLDILGNRKNSQAASNMDIANYGSDTMSSVNNIGLPTANANGGTQINGLNQSLTQGAWGQIQGGQQSMMQGGFRLPDSYNEQQAINNGDYSTMDFSPTQIQGLADGKMVGLDGSTSMYDNNGLNSNGFTEEYGMDGFNVDGRNGKGFDRGGYDAQGLDVDGKMKNDGFFGDTSAGDWASFGANLLKGITGYQAMKTGQKQAALAETAFYTNLNNSGRATNAEMRDRQNSRNAQNPDRYQATDKYMAANGMQDTKGKLIGGTA